MDEAETTTEELRELIREGHATIKDLVQERKEVRKIMGELHELIEAYRNAPKDEVEKVIREITNEAAQQIATECADTAKDAMEAVEKAVFDRFDTLMGFILGMDEQDGRLSIPSLLKAKAAGFTPHLDFAALDQVGSPIVRPQR